ncbi:hypothetical protein EJB05_20359, partial [Eragrostis curvula]
MAVPLSSLTNGLYGDMRMAPCTTVRLFTRQNMTSVPSAGKCAPATATEFPWPRNTAWPPRFSLSLATSAAPESPEKSTSRICLLRPVSRTSGGRSPRGPVRSHHTVATRRLPLSSTKNTDPYDETGVRCGWSMRGSRRHVVIDRWSPLSFACQSNTARLFSLSTATKRPEKKTTSSTWNSRCACAAHAPAPPRNVKQRVVTPARNSSTMKSLCRAGSWETMTRWTSTSGACAAEEEEEELAMRGRSDGKWMAWPVVGLRTARWAASGSSTTSQPWHEPTTPEMPDSTTLGIPYGKSSHPSGKPVVCSRVEVAGSGCRASTGSWRGKVPGGLDDAIAARHRVHTCPTAA